MPFKINIDSITIAVTEDELNKSAGQFFEAVFLEMAGTNIGAPYKDKPQQVLTDALASACEEKSILKDFFKAEASGGGAKLMKKLEEAISLARSSRYAGNQKMKEMAFRMEALQVVLDEQISNIVSAEQRGSGGVSEGGHEVSRCFPCRQQVESSVAPSRSWGRG